MDQHPTVATPQVGDHVIGAHPGHIEQGVEQPRRCGQGVWAEVDPNRAVPEADR